MPGVQVNSSYSIYYVGVSNLLQVNFQAII